MYLDRFDALEKTITSRFESLEKTLHLILTRIDSGDAAIPGRLRVSRGLPLDAAGPQAGLSTRLDVLAKQEAGIPKTLAHRKPNDKHPPILENNLEQPEAIAPVNPKPPSHRTNRNPDGRISHSHKTRIPASLAAPERQETHSPLQPSQILGDEPCDDDKDQTTRGRARSHALGTPSKRGATDGALSTSPARKRPKTLSRAYVGRRPFPPVQKRGSIPSGHTSLSRKRETSGAGFHTQTDSESCATDSSVEESDRDYDEALSFNSLSELTDTEDKVDMMPQSSYNNANPAPDPSAQGPSLHQNGSVDHASLPPVHDGHAQTVIPQVVDNKPPVPPPVAGPARLPDAPSTAPRADQDKRRGRPRVKAEPPSASINPDSARIRLEGVQSFNVTLDPAICSVTVSRRFLNAKFRAAIQSLYSEVVINGQKRKLIFPNPTMNPEVPMMPGRPGLLCRAVEFVAWNDTDSVVRVIVRLAANKWQYLGDYKSARVASLSRAEFVALSTATQNSWVNYVKETKGDPYVRLRAKIALRDQLGREPDEQELIGELATGNKFFDLPPEVVLNAYLSGERFIYIWKLWCVDYDEGFQRRLADEFPAWVPPEPKPKPKLKEERAKASVKHEDSENENAAVDAPQGDGNASTRRSDRLGAKPRRHYRRLQFGEEVMDVDLERAKPEAEGQ
ncbi:hypothetical protein BXZ70DRAFT_913438 [Cristinia sonorae]|uniref:DUF6697 domain-containing protein n=1 Tax=Cristinia sonorae TaxID=1940300 RepID=A0A8K0UYF3_9AGAR|nr:hypothetical protein BXZ70DRAFT_913438 [Cristinia sonorae]